MIILYWVCTYMDELTCISSCTVHPVPQSACDWSTQTLVDMGRSCNACHTNPCRLSQPPRCGKYNLRHLERPLGGTALPLHRMKPVLGLSLPVDPSSPRFSPETQNMLEGLYISSGQGTPCDPPGGARGCGWGKGYLG